LPIQANAGAVEVRANFVHPDPCVAVGHLEDRFGAFPSARPFTKARARCCSSLRIVVPLYLPEGAVAGSEPVKNGVITT
jgi:hypothetical protein